ncbi:hypothetical protein DASC09_051320 [Saccharomycopsis crataegensis]|uniref:SWI5-dependent HO expression protein 3 n=1 Tax=Saccharomycopsis crataegensis TaxID=43959 RepID=A0AAV5QTR9_9ASCO|nr:hypothetical protein DASC09_051320 [Saccharomycopsis crataegensis]
MYEEEISEIDGESRNLKKKLLGLTGRTKQQEEKLLMLLEDLRVKDGLISTINQKISALKIEIIKYQNTIQSEQEKYNISRKGSETIENMFNKFLNEKTEISRKTKELESKIHEKANQSKTLRTNYDETVFKILQSKAKKVSVMEKLKVDENENDSLNRTIKENIYMLKKVSNFYIPKLMEFESTFKNHWVPLLNSLKPEAAKLEETINDDLSKYENLKILNCTDVAVNSSMRIKAVLDKLIKYESKTLEEINSRRSSYHYILNDIKTSYNTLAQNFYVLVGQWLSNNSPHSTTSRASSGIVALQSITPINSPGGLSFPPASGKLSNCNPSIPAMEGSELTNILKTNLFSDLNLRHLGSIFNDSSFNPTIDQSHTSSSSSNTTALLSWDDDMQFHQILPGSADTNGEDGHNNEFDQNYNDLNEENSVHTNDTSISSASGSENFFGVANLESFEFPVSSTQPTFPDYMDDEDFEEIDVSEDESGFQASAPSRSTGTVGRMSTTGPSQQGLQRSNSSREANSAPSIYSSSFRNGSSEEILRPRVVRRYDSDLRRNTVM